MDTTRWGDGFSAQGSAAPPPVPESDAAGEVQRVQSPDAENPFEEPDAAPELRQHRSQSLYSRSAPFWERVVETPPEGEAYPQDPEYWNHPEEVGRDDVMRVQPLRPLERIRRRLTSRGALYTCGALVVVLVIALCLRSVFATVRTIRVEGNTSFSSEYVIGLSGLETGMSTLNIDEDAVKERIGRERYLRCTLVDVSFDAVTLHVRERVPCCSIVQNGRRITLDDRGWVLEATEDMQAPTHGLISVTGLDVQHCTLGQAVTLRMPARLVTYTEILIELRALGGLHLVTELDMTTMDSITLKTSDGLTIQMGNETLIHEKIRAFLVVNQKLVENNYYGEQPEGVIVVSDPTSPAYRPPGV